MKFFTRFNVFHVGVHKLPLLAFYWVVLTFVTTHSIPLVTGYTKGVEPYKFILLVFNPLLPHLSQKSWIFLST